MSAKVVLMVAVGAIAIVVAYFYGKSQPGPRELCEALVREAKPELAEKLALEGERQGTKEWKKEFAHDVLACVSGRLR